MTACAKTYVLRTPTIAQGVARLVTTLATGKRLWEVVVRPHVKRRGVSQNSLYWSWLTLIAGETGHTPEELHEFFKLKFLPRVVVELGGTPQEVSGSTTRLSTVDFSQYLNQIEAFCAGELGLMLPRTDEAAEWAAHRVAAA